MNCIFQHKVTITNLIPKLSFTSISNYSVLLGIFIIALVILCPPLLAKDRLSQNRIEDISTKYPEKDAVIQQSLIDVYFYKDKKNDEPAVKRVETLLLKALKANTTFSINYFRSNNSEFETKPSFSYIKTCGDYEVNGIFHTDAKYCNFTFHADLAGKTFNFEISEIYKDIKYYSIEFFSSELPIIAKYIKFHIPDGMKTDLHLFNMEDISYRSDTLYDSKTNSTIIQFQLLNLPHFVREKKSTSLNTNYPHVLVCSKTYINEDGKEIELFKSLDNLYAWYRTMIGRTNNDTAFIRPIVEEIIADCKNDTEKVQSIFRWVQDNIRYIAFEYEMAGYIPDNAQSVINKKYGDCKGVSNLTKTMLTLAGFDARMCWIGTKRLIYNYSTPSLAIDDHMICAMVNDNNITYLDPTALYTNVGEYPEYIQGKEVLVENGESYILDTIPNLSCTLNKGTYNFDLEYSDNKLYGNLSTQLYGIERARLLSFLNYSGADKEEIIQMAVLHNDKNISWDLDSYEIGNEGDSILTFLSPVSLKRNVFLNSNKLIVKLNPFESIEKYFIDTTRFTHYDFDEKKYIEYNVNLRIPAGFELENLPSDYCIDEGAYKVEYNYSLEEGIILYKRRFYLNESVIRKKDFRKWNDFLKNVRKENNKRVVLKKIEL